MGRPQHHLLVRGPARRGSRHPPADTLGAGSGGAGAAGSSAASGSRHKSRRRSGRAPGTRQPPSGMPAGRVRAARAAGSGALRAHGQPALPAGLPALGNPLQLLPVSVRSHLHAPTAPVRARGEAGAAPVTRRQVPELVFGGAPHRGEALGLGPDEARGQRCLRRNSPLPLSLCP